MESLSDTQWDVVISGTGLQQSLLALALSRSGKNILHVDPNEYYGDGEAAFSLQEVDEWAEKHRPSDEGHVFGAAEVTSDEAPGLGSMRAYSLALAPQLIHSRSKLVTQLVDSKAFRQIEFLAVGSFYIFQPSPGSESTPSLSRIPSTREDVFSNTAIPARSKRHLMKFLKFVLDFDSEPHLEVWRPHADVPLGDFLASEFKLDSALQSYIITLTLSHDGKVNVEDGLTVINRHLKSMGVFGPGFAAIYPKWGGVSEIAQVGCRAAAVGGAVYMLGEGIKTLRSVQGEGENTSSLNLTLTNELEIKAKLLVQACQQTEAKGTRLSRLTAVTKADLSSLFQLSTEGAPSPAVAVVALPAGSIALDDGNTSKFPIYAMIHSSDTGECPVGQYVLYLSTVHDSASKSLLGKALASVVAATQQDTQPSSPLYQLYYEQCGGNNNLTVDGSIATFSLPTLDLAFSDSVLDPVHDAWKLVMGDPTDNDYMKFQDREGADDEDAFD